MFKDRIKIKVLCPDCGDRIETIYLRAPHIWICGKCERDWEWEEKIEKEEENGYSYNEINC